VAKLLTKTYSPVVTVAEFMRRTLCNRPFRVMIYLPNVPAEYSMSASTSSRLTGEMRRLLRQLPSVLEQSLAPSTVKKYKATFKHWKAWSADQNVTSLPADPLHVALYLVKKVNESESPAPVSAAVHAISWFHQISGHPDPCRADVVGRVHQAAMRQLSGPRVRKLPLSKSVLNRLGNVLSVDKLLELQTLTLITLGFAGCLRWDDLSNIFVDSLAIHRDYMAIFLTSRKNDQLREGSWVFINRWKGSLCPVALIEQFLEQGGHESNARLFGRIRSVNGGQVVVGAMSYSRARELIRSALSRIGEDPDRYGVHSLRSGGVSVAAAAGVPDRLIQRHGGWKSEAGMKSYFAESLPNLLMVSKAIGQ